MSSSTTPSATSTIAAVTSSAAAQTIKLGSQFKVVGIILAIVSGLLIGSSFVLKKKGLLRSQAGGELGEGVAYLKSALWWTGMTMMILGEICNFAAYAFVEAIVVTPLGALSVVICAILSSIFLKEKLSFFGWLGCALCILGSTIIALNGPKEELVGQIREFQKLFLAPGFLAFAGSLIVASLVIIFFFAPKYGKNSMLWYISVCSMIGGISVSVTTGLGSAIVTTALGDNQFRYWFMYFLAAFVIITLITEVYYLNVALALFNTAMVVPTYYVTFTFCSMVTSVVLFKGLKASVTQILTLVMAFLVICLGITILQMSKIDPTQLNKLDRRSTILLQAARSQTETVDEKDPLGLEDPGMDTLRGSFGAFGSMIRARSIRRMSQSSSLGTNYRSRPPGAAAPYASGVPWPSDNGRDSHLQGRDSNLQGLDGLDRHQLYDAPVPFRDDASTHSRVMNKRPTIKFDSTDVVHQYNRPGTGDTKATHEHRAVASPGPIGYPPLPPMEKVEPKLLDVESPETESGLTTGAVVGEAPPPHEQTVLIPPQREKSLNSTIRSAPPAIYTRFRGGTGVGGGSGVGVGVGMPLTTDGNRERKESNSRDLFDPLTRETLLSFPSVTDSARSEGWDDDELERQKENARAQDRGRSTKRYPKGFGDDDREESVSLWRRSAFDEELSREGGGGGGDNDGVTEESLSSLPDGGIRLVQQQPKWGGGGL